jgi:hypothetical protein
MLCLREGCFDPLTEHALAAFAAHRLFRKLFKAYDPLETPIVEVPPLFFELWNIHGRVDNRIIPELLKRSQEPDCVVYDVPEDRWLAFVKDLCFLAKMDFGHMFRKIKPITLALGTSLSTLRPAPSFENQGNSVRPVP